MNNKITESQIENYAIELLEKQGYEYIYAPSAAPDSELSLILIFCSQMQVLSLTQKQIYILQSVLGILNHALNLS